MTIRKDSVRWPVLICVSADAELLTVDSAEQFADQQWRDDTGLFPAIATDTQFAGWALELVDSDGRVFTARANNPDSIEWLFADRCYALSDVIQLVQRHAALQGHCCVAKISAGSIQQAIKMVEQLNHE